MDGGSRASPLPPPEPGGVTALAWPVLGTDGKGRSRALGSAGWPWAGWPSTADPTAPGREVEGVYGGGGGQEAEDKEALAAAASGTGQETFSANPFPGERAAARRMGLCVHCPSPAWAAPPWEHVAPRLHSTTWSLPETRPPSGRVWEVWLRHKALGTPEALGSKIVGLETGFQGCALGCLRGWWAGRGHGAGAGLWGAGGLAESSPWGAIWNQAGAPRPFGKT